MGSNLPHRAKPIRLYEICKLARDTGRVEKQTVYSSIDENEKTLRRSLEYGVSLGFLERDGDAYRLTSRGSGLSYPSSFEDSETVTEVFREALEEFRPYRDTLIHAEDRDLYTDVKDSRSLTQSDLKTVLSDITGQEVENREVNVLIKTADAAGLGDYVTGRRGLETRLELSEEYTDYITEVAFKHPSPEISTNEEETTEQQRSKSNDRKSGQKGSVDSASGSKNVNLAIELSISVESDEDHTVTIENIEQSAE